MCVGGVEEALMESKSETFFGSIKSFNSRRGFGFVSCEETAQIYGRDVYLSKDEAMTLASAPALGLTAPAHSIASNNEKSKTVAVQEGDFLSFQVKLSTEGFPQAVYVQKMRRLRGVVSQSPSATADGIILVTGGDEAVEANSQKSDGALEQLLGARVSLPLHSCGQLRLTLEDEVAFCCVSSLEANGHLLEAHRIDLLRTRRAADSVLGCFSLRWPWPANKNVADVDDGASTAASSEDSPDVELQGYALTDRVFLSGMPSDLGVSDLMRFFGKIGGQAVSAIPADCSNMPNSICITFGTTEQVAKFLTQSSHIISENGVTQCSQLQPCFHRQCGSYCNYCACQPTMSSSLSDASITNVDSALPEETDMMQQSSQILCPPCAPCALAPSSPPTSQEIQSQHAASFPVPISSLPSVSNSWRCIHDNIVLAPAVPEMKTAGAGNLCIQWPTVVHASAYIVELLDQCTGTYQQFVRVANADSLPVLTELHVDGLRPGFYAACVRCVAPCSCESRCSPWAVFELACAPSCAVPLPASGVNLLPPSAAPSLPATLPDAAAAVPLSASGVHVLPPSAPPSLPATLPDLCPPPPSAPPSLPLTSIVVPESLPPIPEEEADAVVNFDDDVLTLD